MDGRNFIQSQRWSQSSDCHSTVYLSMFKKEKLASYDQVHACYSLSFYGIQLSGEFIPIWAESRALIVVWEIRLSLLILCSARIRTDIWSEQDTFRNDGNSVKHAWAFNSVDSIRERSPNSSESNEHNFRTLCSEKALSQAVYGSRYTINHQTVAQKSDSHLRER